MPNSIHPVVTDERGMRAAVGEALSTISTARLPQWLFEQSEEPEELAEPPQEGPSHWLFVPAPTGYSVRERAGPPPARGDRFRLDGIEYRTSVVSRSPFRDGRRCAYLQL